MEDSHVKEFCHKIERKSLNIPPTYFNDSAESQDHVDNDHHPIFLANGTSQISPSLKDLRSLSPSVHLYKLLSIMIGLKFKLTYTLLLVE